METISTLETFTDRTACHVILSDKSTPEEKARARRFLAGPRISGLDKIIARYRKALIEIADYGELPGGGGLCAGGCDTPTIANRAIHNK